MPKLPSKDKTPDNLGPYLFHGVDLTWRDGDKNAVGDCPFCGKEGKFGVEIETSKYQCWGGCTGNAQSFVRNLWELFDTGTKDYNPLAVNRKLLYPETLLHWQVVFSHLVNEWLVPGYGLEGKMDQLYRYTTLAKGKRLLPTPTLGHKMFGVNLYDKDKPKVYLCEGPWDAMALWEILKNAKQTTEGLQQTASYEMSLLAESSVLAVPGCNVFFESWSQWFAGKDVFICFDNDHPKKHPKTEKIIEPVGLCGTKRVTGILSASATPPKSISYLQWGKDGVDLELLSGTDVRDVLTIL